MLKPQAPSWIEQLDWLLAAFVAEASRIVIPALDLEELELLSASMPVAEVALPPVGVSFLSCSCSVSVGDWGPSLVLVLFHVSAIAVFGNCPMLDDDDSDCDAMLCTMDPCPLCLLQLRTIFPPHLWQHSACFPFITRHHKQSHPAFF